MNNITKSQRKTGQGFVFALIDGGMNRRIRESIVGMPNMMINGNLLPYRFVNLLGLSEIYPIRGSLKASQTAYNNRAIPINITGRRISVS
jgi:hypothetical protein